MKKKKSLQGSRILLVLCFLLPLLTGLDFPEEKGYKGKDDPPRLFTELSFWESGIRFSNMLDESEKLNYLVYEYFNIGGGVAVGDVNNDGLPDIYLTGNMSPNKLYLNQGDMKFDDVSARAGVSDSKKDWATGTCMADVNGDGWLDIYVCYSGNHPPEKRKNRLYINLQNGKFSDQANAYGLDDPSHSIQAAFFDYDLDGDQDMYLMNHHTEVIMQKDIEKARNLRHPYAGDKLFENRNGRFVDVSEEAGIKGSALGFGLGISVSDINLDGWPDIYVTNDYQEPDYLYINQGNGSFKDEMSSYFQHISLSSMGNDVADFNNDLYPDIYAQDMLPDDHKRQKIMFVPEIYENYAWNVLNGFYHSTMRNMLHLNNKNGSFSEVGQLAGVHKTDWSWGPLFADFDNDGWKDLFISSGFQRDYTNRDYRNFLQQYHFQCKIKKEEPDSLFLAQHPPQTPIKNYFYRNEANLSFSDKSLEWSGAVPGWTNGAAYGDLDLDGDLDLVLNHLNRTSAILENKADELYPERHYLTVRLKGDGQNPQATNAKLYIFSGSQSQYYEMLPVRGFQSSSSCQLHVGLGSSEIIDSLIVHWPDGGISRSYDLRTKRIIEIKQDGSAEISTVQNQIPPGSTIAEPLFFEQIKTPIDHQPARESVNDFQRQPLLLNMLSNSGPTIITGDVNHDGLDDVLTTGNLKNQPVLHLQKKNGEFLQRPLSGFNPASNVEDALFFDADADGDLDLYLVCGGYHQYRRADKGLKDMLYLNRGGGNFEAVEGRLPAMFSNKTSICATDFEGDGDVDLFVGGGCIPGAYPLADESYLLINTGKGQYMNVLAGLFPELSRVGMVSDAEWSDLDGDGFEDLIIAGDFMPVRVYLNKQGKGLEEATDSYFSKKLLGRWTSIFAADFDQDGDEDFILGNFGQNTLLRASDKEPLGLYFADFENKGGFDPVFTYHADGKVYPYASRYEMLQQIKGLERNYPTHESYADAGIFDMFPESSLEQAGYLEVNTLTSVYLENGNNRLLPSDLPTEAQFAPVYAIESGDFNRDGYMDLILAGNQSANRVRLGPVDANFGQLFLGDGKGSFSYQPQSVSGFHSRGDVRSLSRLNWQNGDVIIFGVNNSDLECYQLKKFSK